MWGKRGQSKATFIVTMTSWGGQGGRPLWIPPQWLVQFPFCGHCEQMRNLNGFIKVHAVRFQQEGLQKIKKKTNPACSHTIVYLVVLPLPKVMLFSNMPSRVCA